MKATARVVPPYIYAMLWKIAMYGPLTASEIADEHNHSAREYEQWTPQQVANRLRTARHLGLLERDADGFWLFTAAGRKWITTGAEG